MAAITRWVIFSLLICCCCTCKPTKRKSPRQTKPSEDQPDNVMLNDSPIVSAAIVDPKKSIQIKNTDIDSSSREDVVDLDASKLDQLRGDINPDDDLKSLGLLEAGNGHFDFTKDPEKKPENVENRDKVDKDTSSGEDIKVNSVDKPTIIESKVHHLGPLELKESKPNDIESSAGGVDIPSTRVSQIDSAFDNNIDTEKIMEKSNEKLSSIANNLDTLIGLFQGMQQNTFNMFHNVSDTIGKFFDDGKKLLLSVAPTPKPPPRDCTDIAADGFNTSDSFTIYPDGEKPYKVFCDLESDGGGWTVFQRRFDGSVDFYRDWAAYEHGFGKPFGEHWAGLDLLHELTKTGTWELLVQLEDFNGNLGFAHYASFRVADKDSAYRLSVGAYDGSIGDAMTSDNHNRQFSTPDRDNDWRSWGSCAQYRKGAWWYGSCSGANLNGVYLGPKKESDTGVYWWKWKHSYEVLKGSEMKLRRTV